MTRTTPNKTYNTTNRTVLMGNDNAQAVKGVGTLSAQVNTSKGMKKLGFSNVYHIPELRHNLTSVAKLTDAGATVTFNKKTVRIDLQDKTLLVGHRQR